ncbi:MAG: alpha-glucosidase [Rhodanobacteraceae bacterium]|jgi:alpha-glucosidase (family GH31 glycosyl hydrolase)|nr:MAG: alpha-glucosidase [Rhodanobacteraceae bacterium]
MSLKRALGAFVLVAGLGLILTAHASVTAQLRSVDAHGFALDLDDATASVQMVAPGVLRVHYVPMGRTTPASLVIDPQGVPAAAFRPEFSREGDVVTLRSARMVATWDAKTGTLTVTDPQGRVLMRQPDIIALAQGRIEFEHAANDALYGIGGYEANQPVTAGLLRSGRQVAQAGKQGHAGAPFVWSTSGWGVLVDCDGADFELDGGKLAISGFKRPDADYYILVGTPDEVFGELSMISGPAPLFPKWAMGFTNSQWGIDQKELLDIVKTYRAKHIPLDNFTLDFDWKAWGQGDYGEFRWNPEKFPDGPSGKLAKTLAAEGVHLTGIMKPRLLLGTAEGDYATAHDLWIPGEKPYPEYFSHKPAKDVDFDKPAARRWYGELAIKYGFDAGMAGWWNDEADVYGKDGTLTSNTQFLNMQRALYDAQRAVSDQRVWSINRTFWLGSQRYAYGMWSGDIDTGFASMAAQRTRMLSAIEVGEALWGMDGGGFNGHPSDENYARWIEFGAFTPIFRVHGTFNEKRQPWLYGPVAEAAATAAIRLRYALIPYIYAYQHADRAHGVGLVRPLAFDWPDDPNVRNDVDAWLFGEWLLVSPVVEQGQSSKRIYLPAGTWTDWFSGKTYAGGQTIDLPVDAQTWRDIPLFIRAGAIIPMQPVMDYVGQHPVTTVTVQVFPSDQPTQFDYYDDDGETYAYEQGAYFLQRLAVQRNGEGVTFRTQAPAGSYQPALRHWLVNVHGIAAAAVQAQGAQLKHYATPAALASAKGEGWTTGHDRYGAFTQIKLDAGAVRDVALRRAGH